MKKILTVLTAVSLCAGVMVASYATASQNQPTPGAANVAAANNTTANPCEQRKAAALEHCNNDRCKQHIARSYSKCNVAFAKAHPQVSAQQPAAQRQ